jgi:hypothetical protein
MLHFSLFHCSFRYIRVHGEDDGNLNYDDENDTFQK